MRYIQWSVFILLTLNNFSSEAQVDKNVEGMPMVNYITLSQDYLYAARTGENIEAYLDTLKNADLNLLSQQLKSDHEKLAFWLNIYNASTQVLLKENPDQYKTRGAFFSAEQIQLGKKMLSLDIIEHDILRRSQVKWGYGYINKLFMSSFVKSFQVDKLDFRIHFALNCGAKSCPPIAFYSPEEIDDQLNIATRTYLEGEAEFDKTQNLLKLPAIMGWFRGDFGGKKQMLSLLKDVEIIPQNSSAKIEFKEYDWTLYLDNYKTN